MNHLCHFLSARSSIGRALIVITISMYVCMYVCMYVELLGGGGGLKMFKLATFI